MRHKFEFSPRMLLLALTAVCVILVSISVVWKDTVRPFSNIVGVVVVPMQNGINTVGNWIGDRSGDLKSRKELERENAQLKEKVDELEKKNQNLSQSSQELSDLRKLVSLKEEYKNYPTTGARVIGAGMGNWYQSFIINKGSKDGIKPNMNVLADNGLVGIVTSVGYNYARVKSIISDSSRVSAVSVSSADTCIVEGDSQALSKSGVLDVTYISKNAKMKAGDELVTSQISSKYLEGLRIGTVSNIKTDSSDLTQYAEVTPVVDFSHIRNVLVITKLKEVPASESAVD